MKYYVVYFVSANTGKPSGFGRCFVDRDRPIRTSGDIESVQHVIEADLDRAKEDVTIISWQKVE